MSINNERDEKDYTACIIFIAIIVCLVLWIGGMFLSHWYAKTYFTVANDDNPQALFGDSFGAVNALISAFAFAGVIVAIFNIINFTYLLLRSFFAIHLSRLWRNSVSVLSTVENSSPSVWR